MKKLISILIAISAITSIGFALDANAASVTSSNISVCSRNMSHNGCRIDRSTTINIPESGKYIVTGRVGRGNNNECQAHEDFDLYIDGHFYASNIDDNPCEHSNIWKTHNFPSITLSRGSHTIRMIHRWWNKPSTGSAESVSVSLTFITSPINGSCGSSNGKTFDTKPTSGLCSAGGASGVSGSGPWNWKCAGSNGGKTASCSAQITVAPNCGSSNGKTFDTKPTSGLCSVGNASSVSGSGPWSWTCVSGARTTSCRANITAAPVCGTSDGQTFSAMPTSGLCSVGNASSVSGSGPWSWTCISGARSTDCNANYARTAIQIIKTNGTNSGDSQTIETGEDASFTITVTNTGEENLSDVIVTDEEAVGCSRGASQTEALYEGSLFDAGESFTYTCIDTNVRSSYTNIAEVVANATTSSMTVTDQDSSDVVVSDPKEPVTPDQTPVTPDPTQELEEEDDDGAIGNFVWHDRNKNGIQDPGEEGISGVKLKLYNGNDVKTDRTNSRGRYKFKELDPGQYKIVVAQETLPEGCYQTYDKDGKLDNKIKTRIEGDEYYRKADFGYYCPSAASVAQTSPQTGAGAVASVVSFMVAALSAGFVHRHNTKK